MLAESDVTLFKWIQIFYKRRSGITHRSIFVLSLILSYAGSNIHSICSRLDHFMTFLINFVISFKNISRICFRWSYSNRKCYACNSYNLDISALIRGNVFPWILCAFAHECKKFFYLVVSSNCVTITCYRIRSPVYNNPVLSISYYLYTLHTHDMIK